MKTILLQCGCSASWSMFGAREVLSISIAAGCTLHMRPEIQKLLKAAAEKIFANE